MTIQDQVISALTAWRENRQPPYQADLQSIINVIMNRAAATGDSPYHVCTQHAQFSSISMMGPEADLWPVDNDPQWLLALSLVAQEVAGTLADLTDGSTLYYAPLSIQTTAKITLPAGTIVPFPQGWNAAVVKYQVRIGNQLFFTQSA